MDQDGMKRLIAALIFPRVVPFAGSKEPLAQDIEQALDAMLDTLKQGPHSRAKDERRILELRYGLVDGKAHSQSEVGQVYGLTRERIRQIEAKALRRLRHPSRSRALRELMKY